MDAWVCPKCGKVWGPLVMQCGPCNHTGYAATTNFPPPSWVPPIKRTSIEMRY